MSKVIKSNRLIISSPIKFAMIQDEQVEKNPPDTDADKKIIEETEEMVRDLLLKADLKAKEIIENTKIEAEQVKKQAAEEAEQIEKQAYHQGYQEGLIAAQQEIEIKNEQILADAAKILAEAREKKNEYIIDAKEEIIDLAVNIAEKIICQQLTIQPEAVREVVEELFVLAKPDNQTIVYIQVAPESHQAISEALEKNRLSWWAGNLKIESNPSLTKGSCILITSKGIYRLIVEDAITKIKELLMGADLNE